MHRFLTTAGLALALLVFGGAAAHAQLYTVYSPPGVVVTPTPVVSYYCPPTTVLYTPPPVTTYYTPPTVAYYPPVTSYYAPVTSYYAPTTSYYAPTTVYSAPAAVAVPGAVTTRSYYGLGIFRPRGLYTQSYYTPGVTSYYYPYFR
jgi:hypothetical protein